MDFYARPRQRARISMIPLINIILLLVIFFLISGTIGKIDIVAVDPPFAESGKLLSEGQITIVLGTHEEVLVNDELITMQEIRPVVHRLLKENPDRVISLKADATLQAKDLLLAMKFIRQAGGQNLSLVTQKF